MTCINMLFSACIWFVPQWDLHITNVCLEVYLDINYNLICRTCSLLRLKFNHSLAAMFLGHSLPQYPSLAYSASVVVSQQHASNLRSRASFQLRAEPCYTCFMMYTMLPGNICFSRFGVDNNLLVTSCRLAMASYIRCREHHKLGSGCGV